MQCERRQQQTCTVMCGSRPAAQSFFTGRLCLLVQQAGSSNPVEWLAQCSFALAPVFWGTYAW